MFADLRETRTIGFDFARQKMLEHDPHNHRLKLIDWSAGLVKDKGLRKLLSCFDGAPETATKVIAYARPGRPDEWEDLGFKFEAKVRGYFRNGEDAALYSLFRSDDRAEERSDEPSNEVLQAAMSKPVKEAELMEGLVWRLASTEDVEQLSELLTEAFPDYPTPLTPDHLTELIRKDESRFLMVFPIGKTKPVACASAELNIRERNAEISDCVTAPELRGKGISSWLIQKLENMIRRDLGITDFYSLARAGHPGMNCALARSGFSFSGRLVNNCRMPTGWESIHVWCRSG